MRKRIVSTVVLLALACLALLVTGTRVLIWETKVEPGQTYAIEGWGELGGFVGTSFLVCRYFTGRKIVACPFSTPGTLGTTTAAVSSIVLERPNSRHVLEADALPWGSSAGLLASTRLRQAGHLWSASGDRIIRGI
jgi:hypothetical protein